MIRRIYLVHTCLMLLITCLTQDMSLSNWWRGIGNYELWGKLFGWHSGSALGAIIGIVKISVLGGSWFLSLVGDNVVWKVQSELWISSQVQHHKIACEGELVSGAAQGCSQCLSEYTSGPTPHPPSLRPPSPCVMSCLLPALMKMTTTNSDTIWSSDTFLHLGGLYYDWDPRALNTVQS